ncbi:MIP/aquaporin family protein [Nocardia sp. NPDC050712]|uniref:MIP/aquaporin family protein n=1 Tax=Nocardia sp. NPDC050712 TaxID=3155518 RepID=UPI0033FBE77F
MELGAVFVGEAIGTGVLVLLGAGVVANALLVKSKGFDGGWLMINFGWGLGVMAGVYLAFKTGAHLNPAVTLGILTSGADVYAPGVTVSVESTVVYIAAQLCGAFVGACLAYLAYKKHFDAEPDAAKKLAVFATGPEIRDYRWNLLTEVIATFVLVLVVLSFGHTPSGLGPLAVALLVVGIGASLGGPTGYAINPARDLGPRLAHAVLPIGRTARTPVRVGAHPEADPGAAQPAGSSDWSYAWVPVLGPALGGILAGVVSQFVF